MPAMDRKDKEKMMKVFDKRAEEYKIAIRNIRQKYNSKVKIDLKSGDITNGEYKSFQKTIQKITDDGVKRIKDFCDKRKESL